MSEVVYDAAALIAADRNDRRAWADHKAQLRNGILPCVPAALVAQVSRRACRYNSAASLRGFFVGPLDEPGTHSASSLFSVVRVSDVVDVYLVALAVSHRARIVTGDPDDIEGLVAASGIPPLRGRTLMAGRLRFVISGRAPLNGFGDQRRSVVARLDAMVPQFGRRSPGEGGSRRRGDRSDSQSSLPGRVRVTRWRIPSRASVS
jgi:hypothetical protein